MALSKDTVLKQGFGHFESYPVLASATIYEGGMVGDNGSGYARALVAGDPFLGHAFQGVIATATSGADYVKVLSGVYKLEVTVPSVAITSVGAPVYASDDGTYSLVNAGSNTLVGKVSRYVASSTAIVEFNAAQGSVRVVDRSIRGGTGTNVLALQGYEVDATAYVDLIKCSGHATIPTVAICPTSSLTALGFFGATPVTQRAAITDTDTNPTTITTKVNAIIKALEDVGILTA